MGGYFGTLRNGSTDTEYNKYILVTKSFVNENKRRLVGMEPSKTNQTSWNHATTISHHTYMHLHDTLIRNIQSVSQSEEVQAIAMA